jgi:HEAT repeat protein
LDRSGGKSNRKGSALILMMEKSDDNLDKRLGAWRRGAASVDEIRQLAADLGKEDYEPGVPGLMALLDHNDRIVRYNAGVSLAFRMHHLLATGRLLRMLVEDSDEDCRSMAAEGIGSMFRGTLDPGILTALGRAALEDPEEYVRDSAYLGLLRVNEISVEEDFLLLNGGREIPVDPENVRTILRRIVQTN